jgi:hypothetical protein
LGEAPDSSAEEVRVDELLTIGQFARMCWLSVKTLRLYDEVGLLHPAYVDVVTNYRYYRPSRLRWLGPPPSSGRWICRSRRSRRL